MLRWSAVLLTVFVISVFIRTLSNDNIGVWLSLIISSILTYVGIKIFLWYLFKTDPSAKEAYLNQIKNSSNAKISYKWPSVGNFDLEVVGESNYQNSLKKISGNATETRFLPAFTAILFLENNNKFDKMAVRVDIDEMTVGYLSREDAREYRKLLKRKGIAGKATSCDAALTGGFIKDDGTRASYGVCLDIDLYEDDEE